MNEKIRLELNIAHIENKEQTVIKFDNGHPVSIIDEKGNKTTFAYDANGNLLSITDPSARSITYTYDANGHLKSITDPANRKVQFSYDTGGKLTGVIDARDNQTSFEYNETNRLNKFTDANGHKTLFNFNSEGLLSEITDARSSSTATFATDFTYDDTNQITTITTPSGKTSSYVHNTSGNLVQYKNGTGDTFTSEWNQNENVKSTDGKGSTAQQYDSRGNVTQMTETISPTVTATTNIRYDNQNNPTEVTDPNQNKTVSNYDKNSNEISTVIPQRLEADVKTYDINGNLTTKTELGAPTYNLLENGSFERLDTTTGDFIAWYKDGTTSAIQSDYINSHGAKSVKISGTSSTQAYLWSDVASISAGDKLTLTATGRLDNVAGTGGAGTALYFYDENYQYIGFSGSGEYTGTGNLDFVVTDTAPANSAYVLALVELYNASGTVWFLLFNWRRLPMQMKEIS